jgi:PAS domain S-box-containing protein
MSELSLRRENQSLRASNTALVGQLGDAKQALHAMSCGEVDAVALESAVTPLLLREAQGDARRESAERLRMSQQLRVIATASREFASATGDYPRLLDTIARKLADELRADCVVWLLSADSEVLDSVAAHGADTGSSGEDAREALHHRVSDHVEARATLAGQTLMDPPLAGDSPWPEGSAPTSPVTPQRRLWLPLRLRGQPLGILALARTGSSAPAFDERERDLGQILADHAALAIGNASSYAAEHAARGVAERATIALRRAEGRFTLLAESGLIGILVGDYRGLVEEANDAVLEILGYARDEIVAGTVPWSALTPPEWRAGDVAAIEQLQTTGVAELREKEYVRKDGTRARVLIGTSMLEGEATKCISFVLDITERKDAQMVIARLREEHDADAKFRGLLESAPDAMVAVGEDGAVVLVNGQFERLFGYAREDIIGRPIEVLISDRFGGGPPTNAASPFRSPWRRKLGERLELYARRKDGTEFPIEVSLSPVATAGGVLVSSAIRDITDRKRAEEQRSRLAAIVDSSGDAIIGKTLDGVITSWNQGAERMFGYPADEIVGRSISLLVPAEQAAEETGILQAAARGTVQHIETVRLTRDGRAVDVSLTISPVYDATGQVGGIADVARDVTARKRNDAALIHALDDAETANRELETFSYSVAHDLRSPLRGISSFAELLLGGYHDRLDAEGRDWLGRILASAARMGMLIEALLSLSRVARNELTRESVNLSEVMRASAARLLAAEPDRTVELIIEPELWTTMDSRLAIALADNLLSNALKFTAKVSAPRIEFGATEDHGARTFFVRDNGAGFDMTFAAKLFVPFQRLHAGEEFAGRGIGLATVQRIVHRHGGEIRGEGVVDGGCTFSFTLPPRPDGAP